MGSYGLYRVTTSLYVKYLELYITKAKDPASPRLPPPPPLSVSGLANWLLVIPNYVELLLLDRLAVPPHNFAG